MKMLSIRLLTQNLRRAASLRGFSSASISEKSEITEKSQDNAKAAQTKSSKSLHLFEKLKSMDDNTVVVEEQKSKSLKSAQTVATTKLKVKTDQNTVATRISNAQSVADLLQLTEENLSQQNAMSILTKLSVWTASNQAKVKDFENDYRFLKLSRTLSKVPVEKDARSIIHKEKQKLTELEMVLSIAGEEEASKIVESFSLPQKVRVFSSLARTKSRSRVVLKTLASTISSHTSKLNLKECSDLLFAMAGLNFVDEVLLSRIGIDINEAIGKNLDKTAVVGSIVTSIGFLKYKEPILLDSLTKWIIEKQELCRPKDLASLILTLALVNYHPTNVNDLKARIIPKIGQDDLSSSEWLDYVWALSALELHQSRHLESVLKSGFSEQLVLDQGTNGMLPAQKMKLLNVNGVAKHLTSNYNGPFLETDSSVNDCPIGYRKSKMILLQGLQDTLKNLFTDSSYIRTEYDTKLGFIIDAECVLNENRVPLAVDSDNKNAIRVALMVLDYHDMCKGLTNDPNGFNILSFKLLQKIGYNIIQIPHTEFNTSGKVLKRVQYLDSKLKNIVKQSNK